MPSLAVHPVAALFPMLADDELKELAIDIKQNGLKFPIILDVEGKTLIDGRNRLKACELAGVEPRFERLNGEDTVAFIMSANMARRDLTQNQKAVVLAKSNNLLEWGARLNSRVAGKTSAWLNSFSLPARGWQTQLDVFNIRVEQAGDLTL